ncbi:MAG: peptidyl-prolyl cis-trans isomerase [Acidobacteria bacterium]|nr:peptidyl-prolyl cis-trans isomerase [Acidobacteriota bacterium]MBI3663731.1 peptidyl-prolyl cis-trans isomerase [Acidobacteriota bacterium]
MKWKRGLAALGALLLMGLAAAAQGPERVPAPAKDKHVVEEIIARVNNEIVTMTDLRRARESMRQDIQEECRNCSPAQINAQVAEREKHVLRDLIDQSLLVQRGKDMGLNVETEVVKRMDDIRMRNNLPSMEELQKKVEESGMNWEDFRNNIRHNLLTQEVIRREVGSRIIIDKDEVKKYYSEHQDEFHRPEMVYLSEIFVTTADKPAAELPALEEKAKKLLDRVKKGEDFDELAKRYSDGDTAKQGGDLGGFKRGQLSPELEDTVFKMKAKELSGVIRTKTGFLVLRVDQRYEAGLQPVEKVEGEIMNRLYYEKMQPGMRTFLTKLREESYVVVKPGFTDSSAVASSPIIEVEPTPDENKDKKSKKGKRSAEGARGKKGAENKDKKAGE